MDKTERLQAHNVQGIWMPDPEAHFKSPRDNQLYAWVKDALGFDSLSIPDESILDIGAYDGWLDFLLIKLGYKVEGVELVPELCRSAEMYAKTHKINYRIHQGFFDEVQIDRRFDVAMSFETLEHIPLDLVPTYVAKMEAIAGRILVSVPEQKKEDNPQHLWSPSFDLIRSMWGSKPCFYLEYIPVHGTSIPPNFFCSWSVR